MCNNIASRVHIQKNDLPMSNKWEQDDNLLHIILTYLIYLLILTFTGFSFNKTEDKKSEPSFNNQSSAVSPSLKRSRDDGRSLYGLSIQEILLILVQFAKCET